MWHYFKLTTPEDEGPEPLGILLLLCTVLELMLFSPLEFKTTKSEIIECLILFSSKSVCSSPDRLQRNSKFKIRNPNFRVPEIFNFNKSLSTLIWPINWRYCLDLILCNFWHTFHTFAKSLFEIRIPNFHFQSSGNGCNQSLSTAFWPSILKVN